jgi:hypothetical protein
MNTFNSLEDFFDDLAEWQWQTFGEGYNPLPTLTHLKEEVEEAIAEPNNLEEYADIFILLLSAVDRAGYDLSDLLKAVEQKHAVNKLRTWGKPDRNGVVKHVKETY